MLQHLLSFCIFTSTILDIGGGRSIENVTDNYAELGNSSDYYYSDDQISSRLLLDYDPEDYYDYDNENSDLNDTTVLQNNKARVLFDYEFDDYEEGFNLDSSAFTEDKEEDLNYDSDEVEGTRARILFEYEFDDDKVNFNLDSSDRAQEEDLKTRIFSFEDPGNKAKLITMTATEVNQIFNKRKFNQNKNKRLTKVDRKKARKCRKRDKLFSRRDKKCYHPLAEEPCSTNKWLVTRNTQQDGVGVCRIKLCSEQEDEQRTPLVMVNGTCVPLQNTSCPSHQQIFLNIHGEGFCDCQDGFSKYKEDGVCYRDFAKGSCDDGEVFIGGECEKHNCEDGFSLWEDEECYPLDEEMEECLQSDEGTLELEEGKLTCVIRARSRSVLGAFFKTKCKRRFRWSSIRKRCIPRYRRNRG